MKILAHRGYWKTEDEKNTLSAFEKAIIKGFGIETDIRDLNNDIVISHDPPNGKTFYLHEFFEVYRNNGYLSTLALNIKSDGLYYSLKTLLNDYNIKNYFLFDMSIPEQYIYHEKKLNIYTRSSEFEWLPFIKKSHGIWLDQFTDCNHIIDEIENLTKHNKQIVIVSPELHGRPYMEIWKFIAKFNDSDLISLCTDLPDMANEFFNL